MLRFILGLVGAVFSVVLLISFFSNISTFLTSPPERTAEEEFHKHPKHLTSPATGRWASSTASSCSAGSRSTRKSARPVMASAWSRSATSKRSATTRPK